MGFWCHVGYFGPILVRFAFFGCLKSRKVVPVLRRNSWAFGIPGTLPFLGNNRWLGMVFKARKSWLTDLILKVELSPFCTFLEGLN